MKSTAAFGLDFDDIAELFARVCGVDVVAISERTIAGDAIKLIGKRGILGNIPLNYAIPALDCEMNNLVVFQDVQNDPYFDGHGVRLFFPVIKTLIVAALVKLDDQSFLTVAVPNAPLSFLQSNELFSCFLRVLELVRRLLADEMQEKQLHTHPIPQAVKANRRQ